MDVEVRGRVPGTDRRELPDVLVRLASDRTTVRDLIHRAVEEQLRVVTASGRAALDRLYDPVTAVDDAVVAYTKHRFVIFVNGSQAGELDDEIVLRLGEPVLFLRLTPLVGG